MLVEPRVRMLRAAGCFDGGEMFAISAAVAAEHDNCLTGVTARAPIPITLVTTDGLRQAVSGTKEIDCARLAVAVRENGRGCALGGRQTEVNFRRRLGHILPSEFVGEILRQWTIILVFRFGRFEAESLLISNIGFDGKNRSEDRRKDSSSGYYQHKICGTDPGHPSKSDLLERNGARRKQHRVCGRE